MTATERGVEYVFDTFAWVEELGEGEHAAEVFALHATHDVGTPYVVLAELAHLYERRLPDKLEIALEAVQSTSVLLPLSPEIARAAGITRAKLERTRKGIGLIDCLILETARANDATLVTGDPHLKGLKGVHFLDGRA